MPTKSQTARVRAILDANGQSSNLRKVLSSPGLWKQLLKLYPEAPVRVT